MFNNVKHNLEKNSLILDELPFDTSCRKIKKVWSLLFYERKRMIKLYSHFMPEQYMTSIKHLDYQEHQIPNLSELNKIISLHNWKCVWASKISEEEFFTLVAKKTFPITTYCRDIHEVERSVYPDFIHDLWGHVPLLQWEKLTDIIISIAREIIVRKYNTLDKEINNEISLKAKAYYDKKRFNQFNFNFDLTYKKDISVKKLLSRLFLFTVEFGLQKKGDSFSIFGGGILSSSKEINNVLDNKSPKIELNFSTLYLNEYCLHDKQSCYFILNCLEDIYFILEEIKKLDK